MDKSSGTDWARTVVSTISPEPNFRAEVRRVTIYSGKGDIIISVENKLPDRPENDHLCINLRKEKKEAEEKRLREEEARKLEEAAEKKREANEKRKKEAEKARKKAEKEKGKKKRDRDGAVVSDEGETEAPKRKKPKVREYDPKCERCEKSGVLLQPRMQGVLQGEGEVQPVRRGLHCGVVGACRSLPRTFGLR
ncbi:hypothetical protein B0H13DRAFT_1909963 [Mycena leptocephala]|nr:hypothetical protein B0H13DRAFT_1909963 [Mycena leptocephala]